MAILGFDTPLDGNIGGADDRHYCNILGTSGEGSGGDNDTIVGAGATVIVDDIHFRCNANFSGGESIYMGVYEESGNEPAALAYTQAIITGVNGVATASLDVSGLNWILNVGSKYYIGWNVEGVVTNPITYGSGLANCTMLYYNGSPPLPDPWNTGSDSPIANVLLAYQRTSAIN